MPVVYGVTILLVLIFEPLGLYALAQDAPYFHSGPSDSQRRA